MRVDEIMTKDPMCAGPGTPLEEIARMMVDCDCGGIPICEQGTNQLAGFVTDRDIVCRSLAKGLNPLNMLARDIMTTTVQTVTPNVSVDKAIELMQRYKIRRLPVTDDQGRLLGIVSQADLARKAAHHNREIVEEFEEALEEISAPKMAV